MIDLRSISTGLEPREDGIWYSRTTSKVSYPDDGNEACFKVEDSSFWFRHRNDCILTAVRSFPPDGRGPIFDVGGGNGFVSLALANAGFDAVLIEPGKTGAMNARSRGLAHVVCATAETTNFKPHSLPAIGLFDVIEHIEDDTHFLRSIHSLLRPCGHLYATVPAFSFLWSCEDIQAGHFRRYSLGNFGGKLESAGFEILFASYIFCLLPIPIFLLRSLPYRLGLSKRESTPNDVSRDHAIQGGVLANALGTLLRWELGRLNAKKAMRFGGSCLVVARSRS